MENRTSEVRAQTLVVLYLPFVEEVARRLALRMRFADLDDLVQDGVFGLVEAAARFDPSRGVRFKTFAERRIRGAMLDGGRRNMWPRSIRSSRRDIERARTVLLQNLRHEPSASELAAHLQTTEKRVKSLQDRIHKFESLSPSLGTKDAIDRSSVPAELVPPESELPDEVYQRRQIAGMIRIGLAQLPPRERRIVILCYYHDLTTKEIAKQLSVSEGRISQLRSRALGRLKATLSAAIAGN
jgi:RNA polymerase sigma factor FliA